DDLHGHLAVLEYFLVAHRRLEQMLVLVDPALKIEGVESSHVVSSFAQAADERSLRAPSFKPQVSNARRVASLSAGVSSSSGRRARGQRPAPRAAGLPQKLLPAFRVGMEFFRRPRAPNRLAHRIETVAYGLRARDFAADGKIGVFAHERSVLVCSK